MRYILLLLLTLGTLAAQERARVNLQTGEVLEYMTPRQPAAGVATQWVPVVRNAQPAYNPTNQFLSRSLTFTNGTVIVDWTVQNKTQQQIDDEAAAAALNADRTAKRQAVDNAVATLRQWSDEADAVTVTTGNAVTVLQQTVDHLAVFFDRFADLIESQQ